MKRSHRPPAYVSVLFLWCGFLAFLLPDSVGVWKWVGVAGSVLLALASAAATLLTHVRARK